MSRRLLVVAGASMLLLGAPGCTWDDVRFLVLGDRPHASDQELIENFRRHRADLERLRGMLLEDRALIAVWPEGTFPAREAERGVSDARIDEYRRLLAGCGIGSRLDASEDRRVIRLSASAIGMVTHGSTKGYLYDSVPPHDVLATDLDLLAKQRGIVYGRRRIEGDWYLFYEGD